jgi:hypothetical protein
MRIPFLAATLLATMTASLASPAGAATRNYSVTSFDRIRVDGAFRVSLATGVAPFASATGSSEALDALAIGVEGRTLVVHVNRSAWGGYSGRSADPIEISLGTHDLTSAWLNGSGSLAIDSVKGLTTRVRPSTCRFRVRARQASSGSRSTSSSSPWPVPLLPDLPAPPPA